MYNIFAWKFKNYFYKKNYNIFKERFCFIFWFLCLFYYLICTHCKRVGKEPIWETNSTKKKGEGRAKFCFCCCIKEGTINFILLLCRKNPQKTPQILCYFLATLRGWVFPWVLSGKLIIWAKCVTLAILVKTNRNIDEHFPFTNSNLRENSFTHLKSDSHLPKKVCFVCFNESP